jgi:hypothetical protein
MARQRAAAQKPRRSPSGLDDAFLEQRRRLAEFRVRQERDRARRVAATAHRRRRYAAGLAKRIGVSLDQFDELDDADWETVQREARKQDGAALALLRQQHRRQRAAFRNVIKNRRRFEYRAGNPVHQTCIFRATGRASVASFPFTFNQGTAGLVPPAQVAPPPTTANNLIRFTAEAHANAFGIPGGGRRDPLTPVAGTELVTSHVFETTAALDGVVSVTANYAPLGTIFLGAPGDCFGFGGRASASIELFAKVRIADVDVPIGPTLMLLDERIHAGCDGESRLFPIGVSGGESFQVINPDLGSVDAGETVRVTAGYSIFLSTAWRGVARANFATANPPFFGLNVPVVVVKIAG